MNERENPKKKSKKQAKTPSERKKRTQKASTAIIKKTSKLEQRTFKEEKEVHEKQRQRNLSFKNLSLAHALMTGLQTAWLIPTIIAWPILVQNINQASLILTSLVMIFIIILIGSVALILITIAYFIFEKLMRTKIGLGQILTLTILTLITILSYVFFLNYLLARI